MSARRQHPHTPGPWFVDGGSVIRDRGEAHDVVATRQAWKAYDMAGESVRGTIDPTEADSNLHLLAAAPALLAALESALRHAEIDGAVACAATIYTAGRAAIARARGVALLALALTSAGCAPRHVPATECAPDLALSPYTGRCAAEGSDSWYGCVDDCGAPAGWPEMPPPPPVAPAGLTVYVVDRIEGLSGGGTVVVLAGEAGRPTIDVAGALLPGAVEGGYLMLDSLWVRGVAL